MKRIFFFISASLLLAACSKEKKLVIFSKGPAEVNTSAKTIKAGDGNAHEEKEVMVSGDKLSFKITSPAGEGSTDINGDGLFVVNAKNDTIIGSYVKYGDAKLAQNMVTQEQLKKQIDSVQLLIDNKNVSESNRNFYLLPNTAARVSSNTDAMIVGPYHRMRSAEKVDGKDPEVYRFYSIKEVRENLDKWKAMTVAEKK